MRYSSPNHLPRSTARHRDPQKGNEGLLARSSTGLLQLGQRGLVAVALTMAHIINGAMLRRLIVFAVASLALCTCSNRTRPNPTEESFCGDGKIDPQIGEECDGSSLGDATCASLGFDTGTLVCGADCKRVTTQCTKRCGNGTVDVGEGCDGDAGVTACTTFGYRACSATCALDERFCVPTWFTAGPVLSVMKGGASAILDLPPAGLGDLAVVVPDFFRVETFPYAIEQGFQPGRKLSLGKTPIDVRAADLDGDGTQEIVTVSDDGHLDRYLPNGQTFTLSTLSDAGCPATALVGDGRAPDAGPLLLAAGCATDGGPSAAIVRLGLAEQRTVTFPAAVSLAVGDLEGDGASEVLALQGTELVTLRAPEFQPGTPTTLPQTTARFVVADLDGDGDGDLVLQAPSSLELLENTGQAFAPKTSVPASTPGLLVARDLDLDGLTDLALTEGANATQLVLHRRSGPFTFQKVTVPTGAQGTPVSLSAGDVDGDGDLDLALTVKPAADSASTQVFINKVR